MIEPFRMHPMNIFSSLLKMFKDLLIIILFLFVINFKDVSTMVKIGRLIFFAYVFIYLIYLIIDWWKTTYEINHGVIVIRRGIFQKKQNSIPLHVIQNMTWHTPFYYEWFGITSLRLETSSANEGATVQLNAIETDLAKEIEALMTTYKMEATYSTMEPDRDFDSEDNTMTAPAEKRKQAERTVHFTPTRKEVLKASFLSFSFLGLIPIIAIIYREIDKVINLDEKTKGLYTFLTSSWLILAGFVLLFFIIAIAFGIIQTYLKYGRYEISSDDERIFIHRGVLNEKSFSIQKANVQAIRITQSPLKKLLNFTDIKLISAGSDDEETSDIRSLYPFIPSDRAESLLREILPQFPVDQAVHKLPRHSLYMRMLRVPWFWIFVTVFIFLLKSDWWFLSPILFIMTYLSRFFTYRNTRYMWDDRTIQFKIGGMSTDIFITNRKKVIEVNVKQNVIQKRLGIATIGTVNRVKPVHHEEMRDVPFQKSRQFIQWYQQRSAEIKTE